MKIIFGIITIIYSSYVLLKKNNNDSEIILIIINFVIVTILTPNVVFILLTDIDKLQLIYVTFF